MAQTKVAKQKQVSESSVANSQDFIRKQQNFTLEQLQEIERIGQISPYVGLARDLELFDCLNHWRDLRICGKVRTLDTLGLSKALAVYSEANTRRKGGLIQVPASVVYLEAEEKFTEKDILLSILLFLSNPFLFGTLRDLRKRVRGTLKDYKVKNIIVNNAHYLSYAEFNELMTIFKHLDISVVLAGLPRLDSTLDPKSVSQKEKFVCINDTFRQRCSYYTLSLADTITIVEKWESLALIGTKPMKLAENQEIVRKLHQASEGKLRLLYENLREVVTWYIKHPKAQINHFNVTKALSLDYEAT
ncbi:AAA family ATPase [Chroococcus sp. FPU101]|uniref:AAA family ATPase n=1 Tax=Chroococcus sp. FPU101 TaxID=1974212 RepID=UPI001A9004AD|nr:AAA family ATPase [Chroococcus sp. FPU101]GFE68755.1 hypothetical protein CFPU101_13650 [Chroococcus sp. FPU101]